MYLNYRKPNPPSQKLKISSRNLRNLSDFILNFFYHLDSQCSFLELDKIIFFAKINSLIRLKNQSWPMWPSGIRTHDLLVPRGALYRCATTAAQDKKCNYFFKILAETCFKPVLCLLASCKQTYLCLYTHTKKYQM